MKWLLLFTIFAVLGLVSASTNFDTAFASEEEAQSHIELAEQSHEMAMQFEEAGDRVAAAEHHHEAGVHYHEAALVYENDGDHENAASIITNLECIIIWQLFNGN